MFKFLEGKYQPLAPLPVFYNRILKSSLWTLAIIAFSLALGTGGYHYFGDLDWLDALLNASMILTGMGPVNPMTTVAGKLFSVFYCLYSGIAFLSLMAILITPIYHRFLHRIHLDEDGRPDPPPERIEPPTYGTNL